MLFRSGPKQFLVAAAAQFCLNQQEQFLNPRLDHIGERGSRELARRAFANARGVDHFAFWRKMDECAAKFLFQFFSSLRGRAQSNGDIVGDLVTRNRQNGSMSNCTISEHGDVRRPAANIHQANAELFFILIKNGVA